MKSNLNFGDLNTESDFEKEIEGDIEEIEKEADLYFNYLYLPVLESQDSSLGVFPDDQKISRKGVLLWNSVKTIPMFFKSPDYKILKVKIDSDKIKGRLKVHGGGAYSLPFIPNTIPMEKTDNQSFFSE